MENDTTLVNRGSIAEIVKSYQAASAKIATAYTSLAEAEDELKAAFSISEKHDTDFGVLPGRHNSANENVGDHLKQVMNEINRRAWRTLYSHLEIDRIASIKRRDEIHKKLEEGKLPEITVENIFELFETLNQNVNEFARESVVEVYNWLRPHSDGHEMTRYKTNQKNATFEIGKKLVKTGMVQRAWGGGSYRTNYYTEKYLIALDKVFHMLDGKNMREKSYRSPLVDAINTSEGGTVQTDYFFCRMYQNGNLHIEFTRLDLVKEFNRISGGMNLKPAN